MSPKQKGILWLSAGIPILMVMLLLLAARGAGQMAHWDHVQAGVSTLAQAIDLYQEEHGSYPPSLEQVWTSDPDIRTSLRLTQIVSNRYGDRFTYQENSNGFLITVIPTRWLTTIDPIHRQYSKGGN